MTVCAVIGGQYGSEGKGAVVARIAKSYDVHVRVGAANAGHTLYTGGKVWDPATSRHYIDSKLTEKHVMQQIPCAAYAHPHAVCVIGAGALISPDILWQEYHRNRSWRDLHELPPLRLVIDPRAHVIQDRHIRIERMTDLAKRIGSMSATASEGIGAAAAARVMRTDYQTVAEWAKTELYDRANFDVELLPHTAEMLNDAIEIGTRVLLEGTQGTGLSNVTGQYPYVTSRCTTVAGLLADTGVAPCRLTDTIMVLRTAPIRVAGNSGPFWSDSHEITWDRLGVDENTERTTVTKKIRRVATLSYDQAAAAARLNGATEIALMLADYMDPTIAGHNGVLRADEVYKRDNLGAMVKRLDGDAAATGAPVTMLGTGPATMVEIDRLQRSAREFVGARPHRLADD